jgi:uncharacterized OsmC-like protein
MLLQALLACAGVTMRSVATAMGIDIVDAELHATGMFDARGTLGVSRDVPIGVQEISIVAELRTDADDATLVKLGELTERYCVVGQSLAQMPSIVVRNVRHRDALSESMIGAARRAGPFVWIAGRFLFVSCACRRSGLVRRTTAVSHSALQPAVRWKAKQHSPTRVTGTRSIATRRSGYLLAGDATGSYG